MKRPRHRSPRPPAVSLDTLHSYMTAMSASHNEDWQQELMSGTPYWTHLLSLHLRLIELDHLEEAVKELL